MQNVLIPRPGEFKETLDNIRRGGAGNLHVVSDFDKTLTRCFVNGKKIPSLISILRDGHFLAPDYSGKAQALYDKYHAIEIDPSVPLDEKRAQMLEWWTLHYELLIGSGLKKDDIAEAAKSEKIRLREGVPEFFEILNTQKIPLVILSAAGLGTEMISMSWERNGMFFDNIHIISNAMNFDDEGRAVSVKEPIVHSLNKNYEVVKADPVFEKLLERKNIFLLGDGLEDADMAQGFRYDNLIKFGFFNEKIESDIEKYKNNFDALILSDGSLDLVLSSFKKNFDALILGDGPMECIIKILEEIKMQN
jgi:cytosolic 5'-nucleotidase 3